MANKLKHAEYIKYLDEKTTPRLSCLAVFAISYVRSVASYVIFILGQKFVMICCRLVKSINLRAPKSPLLCLGHFVKNVNEIISNFSTRPALNFYICLAFCFVIRSEGYENT